MTCTRCSKNFCYFCGRDWTGAHRRTWSMQCHSARAWAKRLGVAAAAPAAAALALAAGAVAVATLPAWGPLCVMRRRCRELAHRRRRELEEARARSTERRSLGAAPADWAEHVIYKAGQHGLEIAAVLPLRRDLSQLYGLEIADGAFRAHTPRPAPRLASGSTSGAAGLELQEEGQVQQQGARRTDPWPPVVQRPRRFSTVGPSSTSEGSWTGRTLVGDMAASIAAMG